MIRAFVAVLASAGLGACVSTSDEAAAPAAPGSTPAGAAAAFYTATATLPFGGVPDAAGIAVLAPLITADLEAKLTAADSAEQAHFIATNNEEPPYVQGDLFSALFEGTTSTTVGACTETGAGASCSIAQAFTDASGTSEWTDTVELVQQDGAWKVSDIVYGGDWDFATKGRLTEVLDAVAAEGAALEG